MFPGLEVPDFLEQHLLRFVEFAGPLVLVLLGQLPQKLRPFSLRGVQPLDFSSYLHRVGPLRQAGFLVITQESREVTGPLVLDALPNTALVAVGALCLVTAVAVPVGLATGLRDGRLGATVENCSVLGRSAPNVVLAGVAAAVLWPGESPARGPVLALTTVVVASALVGTRIRDVSRAVREARRDGHVDAARAKGLSRSTVFWRHLAPAALLAHLRQVADDAAYLVGAVVVVEAVVPAPTPPSSEAYGLGRLFYQASIQGDFPLAATLVVLLVAVVVAVRLLGDLALALVDPRVGPRAGHR